MMRSVCVVVTVLLCWGADLGHGRQGTVEKVDGVQGEVQLLGASEDGTVHLTTQNQHYYRYQREGSLLLHIEYPNQIISLVLDKTGNAFFTVMNTSSTYDYYFLGVNATQPQLWVSQANVLLGGIVAFVDKEDHVYLADAEGVYIVRPNGTRSTITGLNGYIKHRVEDAQGNIYFCHGDEALHEHVAVLISSEKSKPNPAVSSISDVVYDPTQESVATMQVDSQGNVFFGIIGSQTSLKKLSPEGRVLTLLPYGINTVGVDHKDLVYATTWGSGKDISLFAIPAGSQFPVYVLGLIHMPEDFLGVTIDSTNSAYFATAETAIYLLPGGALGNTTAMTGIPSNQSFQLMRLDHEQNLLVLLDDIFIVSSGTSSASRVEGLPTRLTNLLVAPDNSVYVGTSDGLYRLS